MFPFPYLSDMQNNITYRNIVGKEEMNTHRTPKIVCDTHYTFDTFQLVLTQICALVLGCALSTVW